MAVNLLNRDFSKNQTPKTLQEAVKEGFPISVISKVTGIDAVYNQVEFDLIKYLSLLNLNLTVKENQYPFIVRELVDTFSNESIQDFQLCFKNGVNGKYGKIYNIDLSVLSLWMAEYLEDKYQLIESGTLKEKDEPIPDVDYEKFKERRSAMQIKEAEERQAEFNRKKMEAVNELEYMKTRNEYKPDDQKGIDILLRQEWRKECFDPLTGEPRDNYLEFNEWKKL